MTKTEALAKGIVAHGGQPVESRATRYQTYALDLPVLDVPLIGQPHDAQRRRPVKG